MEYLKLGASLYVPAIHDNIISIAKGEKFPNLKSVIFDTEDAILEKELPLAYENLTLMLRVLETEKEDKPLVFIRVRNPQVLKVISQFENIEKIDGFVLPKFNLSNMEEYMSIEIKNKYFMPILEKGIFDFNNLEKIRNFLLDFRDKVLSIRIGATDIMGELNLRRDFNYTIYQIGFVNQVIANIVTLFKPYNFNISAPVWDDFSTNSVEMFKEEVRLDLLNGLFGKSIIHPSHIDLVHHEYKVTQKDYDSAIKLLSEEMPAVFKVCERMNEKTTHTGWAKNILHRAEIYGIKEV